MGQTWTLPLAGGATASGFSLDDLTVALLVGSLVLVVAVAAVRLSLGTGLPSLLIYLGIGLVLGEAGLGITYDNQQQTQVLGYAALVLILIEGGITTRWSGIRRSVAPAALLATVGVGVSVLVVGVAAHLLLSWDWQIAFLVAAVLASTDAAAVFSVLRRVPLPRQITGVLEAESGFNDAARRRPPRHRSRPARLPRGRRPARSTRATDAPRPPRRAPTRRRRRSPAPRPARPTRGCRTIGS